MSITKTPRPPDLGAKDVKFWDKRDRLLTRINTASLKWFDVSLANGNFKIKVCSPVSVTDVDDSEQATCSYVPVTARQTYQFAKDFCAYPLTRAVADQAHLQAVQVAKSAQDAGKPGEAFDLDRSSAYFCANYSPYAAKLVSGAHKIWVLSAKRTSVNHGFYVTKVSKATVAATKAATVTALGSVATAAVAAAVAAATTEGNKAATPPTNTNGPLAAPEIAPGPLPAYLGPQYSVIQNIGADHDEEHWDYSQLLQLMKDFTDGGGNPVKDKNGGILTLLQALKNKHPAIWDETQAWIGFGLGQENRLTGGK